MHMQLDAVYAEREVEGMRGLGGVYIGSNGEQIKSQGGRNQALGENICTPREAPSSTTLTRGGEWPGTYAQQSAVAVGDERTYLSTRRTT